MRNTIINERKISLNEIFMELYSEKYGTPISNIETADAPYKNFVKDNTKKLKETFKAMKCDIEQFKNEKDRYELPIVVAEIFKIYLEEESGKGSFISKVKGKKFLEISLEEKTNFIEKVAGQLKEKYKDDKNKEIVYVELEDLHNRWLSDAEYSNIVKEEILLTETTINLLIESAMIKVGSISELDGLLTVSNGKYEEISEEHILEEIDNGDPSDIPYRAKLNYSDRLELLKYLKVFMIKNIRKWEKIVDIACEIREVNITANSLDGIKIIESGMLVKAAIEEYENEINERMQPAVIPKYTHEEIQNLMKEIRFQFKEKKKT